MKHFCQITGVASTLAENGYSVSLSPNTCALLKDEQPFLITTDDRDDSYVRVAFICVDVLEEGEYFNKQLRAATTATSKVKCVKALVQGGFLHFVVELLFAKVDEIRILERAFEYCLYAEKVYRGIMKRETGELTPSKEDAGACSPRPLACEKD